MARKRVYFLHFLEVRLFDTTFEEKLFFPLNFNVMVAVVLVHGFLELIHCDVTHCLQICENIV